MQQNPDDYTAREAASILGVALQTLAQWRAYGGGPAYYSVGAGPGRGTRYPRAALHAFAAGYKPAHSGEVSERVKELLVAHPEMTQREIAERAGCHPSLVSRIAGEVRRHKELQGKG